MSVVAAANRREITELLHYTTRSGILGVLRTEQLLSREKLEVNEETAYIREPIWPKRIPRWDDYVSLSVSQINSELHIQSKNRYPEQWWGILSFSIELLDHDNVWFATCNNLFPSCERNQQANGFEKIFANEVEGKYQRLGRRSGSMSQSLPTDRTAEVLYPTKISISHLQCIYVSDPKHRAQIIAWFETFSLKRIEIIVDTEKFT